jgi:DUF1365 family protein
MSGSSLYVGTVVHRRLRPRDHKFRYRAFWLLLDLDELPQLAGRLRLFSHNRGNFFGLHDVDHGDGGTAPLRVQVERHLAQAGCDIAGGSIKLFCMPRTLGYSFNPLSVYFCYRADTTLAALIYEVHNTFGERHCYVMPFEVGATRQACRKVFYVSPFMDMDMRYEFHVRGPADRAAIAIRVSKGGEEILHASLAGARRELTDRALLRMFLTIPAITLKVTAAIHWEALRLWLKGMRVRTRPAPPRSMATIVATRPQPSPSAAPRRCNPPSAAW